jgi:hypothetical protein
MPSEEDKNKIKELLTEYPIFKEKLRRSREESKNREGFEKKITHDILLEEVQKKLTPEEFEKFKAYAALPKGNALKHSLLEMKTNPPKSIEEFRNILHKGKTRSHREELYQRYFTTPAPPEEGYPSLIPWVSSKWFFALNGAAVMPLANRAAGEPFYSKRSYWIPVFFAAGWLLGSKFDEWAWKLEQINKNLNPLQKQFITYVNRFENILRSMNLCTQLGILQTYYFLRRFLGDLQMILNSSELSIYQIIWLKQCQKKNNSYNCQTFITPLLRS